MNFREKIFGGDPWKNQVVCDLDPERYLGIWYEIARFPHSFEAGLEDVTASYSMLPGGKIKVVNSGKRKGKYQRAEGKAYIPDPSCKGRLRVSFFPLFSSQYNVLVLDKKEYHYAVVAGKGYDYLWFLCRKPRMDKELYESLLKSAQELGFAVEKLEKVRHTE